MPDGIRLAARIWLPADAHESPVPAILEFIPYRKGDTSAISDSRRAGYIAAHGYAYVRVDLRGSGDSEGVLLDEYCSQEQQDGFDLVSQIAAEPWCNDKVGMTGISWGGFNALQVAAMRPPALKAVISACSTDDRYADDVHYRGGSLLTTDLPGWTTTLMSIVARPPDPVAVGDTWIDMWRQRLEHLPHYIENRLKHQQRDDYWANGSVCENYSAIECPVLLVGGWADGYTNAVFRMLEHLGEHTRALVGPWAHGWPDGGLPGPQINYLDESLRWWNYWLKGIDTGVMTEPKLRYWLQDHVAPASFYKERPGHWSSEPAWPSPAIVNQDLYLDDGQLTPVANDTFRRDLEWNLAHGQTAGVWCPFGADLPGDQAPDDLVSTCFDSAPVPTTMCIVGVPTLHVTVSEQRGQLVARLCDVAPDGTSLLISRGMINLGQSASSKVCIMLDALAHRLPAGHHLRLSLATSYWPMLWPTRTKDPLQIADQAMLALPVRTGESRHNASFSKPVFSKSLEYEVLERPAGERRLVPGHVVDESTSGRIRIGKTTFHSRSRDELQIEPETGKDSIVTCRREVQMDFDGTSVGITINTQMTSDDTQFIVATTLASTLDAKAFVTRQWHFAVPRED